MQIDWLTVTAQIVNFLILVWLLQHFLYGPITSAMATREERIENRVAEAERARADAEAEAERLRDERSELAEARERELQRAREEARDTREALAREAREEVDEKRRAWHAQLRDEREDFLDQLRRRAGDAFHRLARRALVDLADADLEERIARTFVGQLRELDDQPCRALAAAGSATVKSRFELPAGAKRQLTKAIHDLMGQDVTVAYATDEKLPGGIVLEAGSRQVAWTLDSWLDGLQEAVREPLDAPGEAGNRERPERAGVEA